MKVFTIYKPYDGSCGDFLNREDADRVCEALNELEQEERESYEYDDSLTEEENAHNAEVMLDDKYVVVESVVFESAEEAAEWLKKSLSSYYENLKLKEK